MTVELIGKTVWCGDDTERSGEYLCGDAAALCKNSTKHLPALKGAMSCGHESVLEHCKYTFRISGISRVTLAQLTRHRIAAFSVQSQRYCGIEGQKILIPKTVQDAGGHILENFISASQCAMTAYQTMIADGIPEEDARYIIPQGITCTLDMSMNVRELRHFFSLRMCRRAQWEIRQLADEMYRIMMAESPVMFRDAGPGCVRGTCPEGKGCCGNPRKAEIEAMAKA